MVADPLLFAAVISGVLVGAAIDLRTRRVPNWLTGGMAAIGLAFGALQVGGVTLTGALTGGAVGLVLMLPLHVFARTGAGDVKLLAAAGTLLGPRLVGLAFVYTVLVGGVLAVLVAIARGRLGRSLASAAQVIRGGGANVVEVGSASADNTFAYAPAIAVGALLALLRG